MKKELKMLVDAGRKSGKIKNADVFTLTSSEVMSIVLHKGFTLKEASNFYLNYFDTNKKATMIVGVAKRIKEEKEAYVEMVHKLNVELQELREEDNRNYHYAFDTRTLDIYDSHKQDFFKKEKELCDKIKEAMKARPDIYEFAYQETIGIEFDGNSEPPEEMLKIQGRDAFWLETDGTEYDEPDIVDAPFYHGKKDYFKNKENENDGKVSCD